MSGNPGIGWSRSGARNASTALGRLLGAGVALVVIAGLTVPAEAANRKKIRSAASRLHKRAPAKPPFGNMPEGPLQIVVSIANQHVTLYSNGVKVAQAPVSTGVPGHRTPTGVFSVIGKDRYHHSNLYSNAPMPYMQRITWSGVALHEGPLPGRPASHGCIRMPHDFASRLWRVTRLGVRVIVSPTDVAPRVFSHPLLFNPKQKPPVGASVAELEFDGMRSSFTQLGNGYRPVKVMLAAATSIESDSNAIEMSRQTEVTSTSTPENAAAPDPVKPAFDPFPPLRPPTVSRKADLHKFRGHVAVFVSRKTMRIYVRQGFIPMFDMPVRIADPKEPLGTHVFTATGLTDNGVTMRWNEITVPASTSPESERSARRQTKAHRRHASESRRRVASKLLPTAAQALDRITIPQEAVDRISEIITPGSSLVVSDEGLGRETGRYTDFIVETR